MRLPGAYLTVAAALAAAPLAAQNARSDRVPRYRWAVVGGFGIDAGAMGGKLIRRFVAVPIDLTLGAGRLGVAGQVCLRLPARPPFAPLSDAGAAIAPFLSLGLLNHGRPDRRYLFIEAGQLLGVGSRAHLYGEFGVGIATRVAGVGGVETVPTLRYQVGFAF